MKLFHYLLSLIFSSLILSSHYAYAAYGVDDVPDDTSAKDTSYGTEVEVPEFVILDSMPHIELYYYPYSATDADSANNEDVPGGAGSVYVGGGEIRWHANVDSTLSIDDFVLTNTDSAVTERNEVVAESAFIHLDPSHVTGTAAVAALDFDKTNGVTVASMSADMTASYALSADSSSQAYDTDNGHTDFATKFYFSIKLGESGNTQGAGTYQATATVRALPTVSS